MKKFTLFLATIFMLVSLTFVSCSGEQTETTNEEEVTTTPEDAQTMERLEREMEQLSNDSLKVNDSVKK